MTHLIPWTVALVAIWSVIPTTVWASMITLEASGTVTSFSDPQLALGISAKAGDALTLDYTFDTSVAGTTTANGTQFNGAIGSVSYRINNGAAMPLNVAEPSLNAITYVTGTYPTSEGYQASAGGTAGAVNPILFDFSVQVVAETSFSPPLLITGNSLQNLPAFSKYLGSGFPYATTADIQLVQLSSTSRNILLDSRITGVSAVPIPAAFWLFASGLLGILVWARRSHKSKSSPEATKSPSNSRGRDLITT